MQEKDEELTKLLEDYEEVIKLLDTAKKYCGDLEKDHDNISRFIEVLECWAERLYSKQTSIQNLRLIEGAEKYRSQTKKLIDEESE